MIKKTVQTLVFTVITLGTLPLAALLEGLDQAEKAHPDGDPARWLYQVQSGRVALCRELLEAAVRLHAAAVKMRRFDAQAQQKPRAPAEGGRQ